MRRPRHWSARPGFSLLEVIMALAIFLIGMVALNQILNLATKTALDIRRESIAVSMAQSQLAQVVTGIVPLSSQGETAFDNDPDWVWSMDVSSPDVPAAAAIPDQLQAYFQYVTIHVSFKDPAGNTTEYCSLSQLVLDPSQRGASSDTITATNSTASTSSGSSSGSGSTTPQANAPAASGGGAAGGGMGGGGMGGGGMGGGGAGGAGGGGAGGGRGGAAPGGGGAPGRSGG